MLNELRARGLTLGCTDYEHLEELLREPITFYLGFDPTASSLHLGNLVPMALARRLMDKGHRCIALIGSFTAMIGDPSGKSHDRPILPDKAIFCNAELLEGQIKHLLPGVEIVDNLGWYHERPMRDFIRDIGRHIPINYMLDKESVKRRLDSGISFNEFSYMLLQAYDFVHLAQRDGCQLQIGGSDQWGNITTGIELGRRMGVATPMLGLTTPLLVDRAGEKIGKTSAGSKLWLNKNLTGPFALYQYLVNLSDQDATVLWPMFSNKDYSFTEQLLAAHQNFPGARLAQLHLSEAVVDWVHGHEASEAVINASDVLFGNKSDQDELDMFNVNDSQFDVIFDSVPNQCIQRDFLKKGVSVLDMFFVPGLGNSHNEIRRLAKQGALYVNNIRINDYKRLLHEGDLLTQSYMILRVGKKNYNLVKAI